MAFRRRMETSSRWRRRNVWGLLRLEVERLPSCGWDMGGKYSAALLWIAIVSALHGTDVIVQEEAGRDKEME